MSESRGRRPIRWLSLGVTALFLVITAAGAYAVRSAVQDQEMRLLSERAGEVGLILSEAYNSFTAGITTAANDTRLDGGDQAAFERAADAAGPLPANATLALAQVDAGGVHYLDTVGAPLAGAAVPVRDGTIRRAVGAQGPVTTGAFVAGGGRRFGVAGRVGSGQLVVYRETKLSNAPSTSATARQQPFQDLEVALYSAPRPDPGQLIFTTTTRLPLHGDVATHQLPIGSDQWLVVASATRPLVGSFASRADWLIAVLGVILALAMGVLLEAILRGRDYALTLVADRTAALRESISQLEDAQSQLVRQERLAAIGELASAVGHELRNPLGVVTNALYLVRSNLGDGADERITRQLATAEREVGAASLIVGDLLDFARAREPVTSEFDVRHLVAEVLQVVPPPQAVNVTVPASATASIRADRDQLRQVLLNLISNAYDAMPEGGELRIDVRAAEGNVRIEIADTGSGMDAETSARIFEPFFTQKAKGIGLGLAVTRRIVEAHDGTIKVTSAPNNGTQFEVVLPSAGAESVR